MLASAAAAGTARRPPGGPMSFAALVVVALLQPAAPGDKPVKGGKKAEAREVKNDPPPAGKINGPGPLDDARKVAEAYLNTLAGKGGDESRDLLLGGATLTARDFAIPNWRITSRDEARVEEKSIFGAMKAMWMLDKIGAEALNMVVVQEDDNLTLTQEQAAKMLAPTREAAVKFQDEFPLFSYVARVDKDVFWHPENPWRKEAKKLGKEGNYKLEVHRFMIEEREQGKQTRLWPLRVLRVKSAKYDSGWKILPASDWDPNY
jgi:hypothetical protein